MGIYEDHSEDQIKPVMRLSTRTAYAVPVSQMGRFWRSTRPDGAQGSWFLPGDDPQWDELLVWHPFATQMLSGAYRGAVLAHDRRAAADAQSAAIEAWWAAVRATDWGNDPLWAHKTDGLDHPDDPADDDGIILRDESHPEIEPRYPRRELRTKYGTTSQTVYAASQGLPSPYPARAQ